MRALFHILPFALSVLMFFSCGYVDDYSDAQEKAFALLDEEIERFPEAISRCNRRIDSLCRCLDMTHDTSQQLCLCKELTDIYSRMAVDSMALYAEKMLSLAEKVNDKDAQIHATMALCTIAQMKEDFSGALNRLDAIDVSEVNGDLLREYYSRCESVYYSLFIRAFNSPEGLFLNYHASYYRDRLTALRQASLAIDSTDFKAAQIRISELRDSKMYVEALALLKSMKLYADTDAKKASWHRYNAVLYDFLDDQENRLLHLAMSSVYNLRLPTRDNLSLIDLARALRKRGDLERASRYISLATDNSFKHKQVARMSYAASASNKIMAVLAIKEKTSRIWLYILLSVLFVLLLIAIYALYYNLQLRQQLEYSNRQLHEANLIKNNYLFEYMVSSAGYIDSADIYHKELRRIAKKDGVEKVYDILKLPSRFEGDKRKFYAMFDENFLTMFPHFIDKVNEMMRPGSQYVLLKTTTMPVELRVLAVMRMGMTDSTQIARFMNYSKSTVYTYRCRAAEKSIYSREEFERLLLTIPLE